jgi:hypothetical protein
MILTKPLALSVLSFTLLIASVAAHGQDTIAAREAAAERYLKAVPMSKMLDDTFAEISKQVPVEQRAQFSADMKKMVRVEFLEKLSRDAMVKTFTTDELNALADFYGSKHGSSAMLKFGAYMGQVMPGIQAEVQRGVQQLLLDRQNQQQRPL